MKTKAKSYRFDENDLELAISKSGIQKTQKLFDWLLAEYVRDLKPTLLSLPKDYVDLNKAEKNAKEGSDAPDPSNKGAYLKYLREQGK